MIHSLPRAASFAVLAAVGVAALAGCSTPSTPTDPEGDITLAAVFPNTSDAFFLTMSCGAESRAAELGVDLQTFNSTNTDTNTVASNFQSATLIDPDGMIVNTFVANQFVAQWTDLGSKGVPVVTASGTDPQSEYQAIFTDTDTAGIADEVADLIPEGEGKMVFLGGAPGIPPLELRTTPFVEAVQEMRPDLTPLPTDYSGFDINKATTSVSAMILANPDLKLIIAADGPDGVGAAAAIQQAGKTGEITLIAFDAVPPEVDALRAGTISALIAQDPFTIGTNMVDSLVDYIEAHPDGGPVESIDAETVPNFVLTSDNVDDPDNANYLYKTEC